MACATLIPLIQQVTNFPGYSFGVRSRFAFVSFQRATPSVAEHFPGCRNIVRQAFIRKGYPDSAIDTVFASISEGTLKQYTKPIRLWWTFCKQHVSDWFEPNITLLLNFLEEQLNIVLKYGTLNPYRSALSLILNIKLGSDDRIKHFCKGASVLKLPKPKYALSWDPAPVIAYLGSLWPHENLELNILSGKLATLLALTSAQRVQTLSLIKRANIVSANPIIIKIPDRVKTSGINHEPPSMVFHEFGDHPEVCVATLIRFYLEKTKKCSLNFCGNLFITINKKPATAQIRRWIKSTLSQAGIDTTMLSAHSTAARLGVSMDEIRKSAGWSRNSGTFAKFYNRPMLPKKDVVSSVIFNR